LGSRVSLLWLVLLEVVAVAITGLLYSLDVIGPRHILWVLALAVALAGGIFILLTVLWKDKPARRNERPAATPMQYQGEDEQVRQYMSLGRQLLNEERFDEATKMFEEALGRNSSHWPAYNYLGLAYSRKGLFDEAIKAYEKAISLEYNYASAHFNLATACEKLGERAMALDRWTRYVDVGEAVGERSDLLDHARRRIEMLTRSLKPEADEEV